MSRMRFSDFVSRKDKAVSEAMDHNAALDFVLAKLRLPSSSEGKRDELETILSMPLKGYGTEAIKAILEEPNVRQLPTFQTRILPALTKPDTTVGRLVSLLSERPEGKMPAPDRDGHPEHDPEPEDPRAPL